MKRISILTLLFFLSPILWAQEITVQAPESVYVGDNFTVRFVVNEQAKDFRGPSFKGFSLRAGPSTSSSTSMSFINGQMSKSVSTTFSYTLTADVEGTFTIDPATCIADGKKISSKSVTVKVEKMSAAAQQQRQQQQQQRQAYDPWAQQPQQASQIDANTLFARASVNKSNPYQGEQVIITYKIYTQVPISQFAIDKLPGNKGFWSEDLSVGQQIKQYEETYNDRRYQVAEIRRGALFAQESGKLTIEPLDLNVLAMVQRQRRRTGSIWDLFDDPFFNAQQAVERPLSTNSLNINVRPLPTAPQGFSGGVGQFDANGSLSLNKVKANEAVSYRITVSGKGNLMLIDAPQPQFPSAFEVYDPQIDDNIKKSDAGISGSRTYEWVLIPRSKGEYTIPAFDFVYFDPSTGQYVKRRIPEQKIEVERGDSRSMANVSSKDDVQLLAQDINYIHPTGKLKPIKREEHAGWPFWTALGLIVALFFAANILLSRYSKQQLDVAGTRMKGATRKAKKRLKKAAAHLGDSDTSIFYEEIYKAIWGCLADKYNIELSQLNRDTVSACLVDKQVPEAQQQTIMKLLQDVDLARFAPGDPETQKQTIYTEALTMIAGL
ncbi:MAG: protein BatD [Bacteroidales bacterium]|nr:protein BatD [Bacteroidales bacterium]